MFVMQMILAGTGTSHGIPVIGCSCPICMSRDAKNKRFRTSAFIKAKDGSSVIIDTGPEFRMQALQWGLKRLDAILLTHTHADHLHGLDDVRIFSHNCTRVTNEATQRPSLKLYANDQSIKDVQERFSYIFKNTQEGGGKPRIELVNCAKFSPENPLKIGSLEIIPIPMKHGELDTTGWLIREGTFSIAYLTDCNFISDTAIETVKNCNHLIIDGLRKRPHTTHLTFDQAVDYASRIGAKYSWITHICHDYLHEDINNYLKEKSENKFFIQAAYDGLTLDNEWKHKS